MAGLTKLLAKKKTQALELLSQNRLPEAKAAYQKLLKKHPDDAAAWYMLGTVEGRMGDLAAAEKAMSRSVQVDSELSEGWLGLGQVLELQGNIDDAIKMFEKALSINPDFIDANVSLGRALVSSQLFGQAVAPLEKALDLGCERVNVVSLYGNALAGCSRNSQAVEVFENLLKLYPDSVDLLCRVGGLYIELSDLDMAQSSFNKAIEINPEHIGAKLLRIGLYRIRRDYKKALPEIESLFSDEPENIDVAISYSQLCHLSGGCDTVISRLEGFLADYGLSKENEVKICFELGRLCDANKTYDKAFGFFKRGNKIKTGQYNANESSALVSAMIDGYDQKEMHNNRLKKGCEQGRPIFIVGMPRSGTTLLEEILSSHPDVYGAGELGDMGRILREYRNDDNSIVKISCEAKNLLSSDLELMAGEYRSCLDSVSSGERYVIDKLPGNFIRIGLIAMLFPDAKIINCIRDPIDTCLSCYFHNFTGYHSYLYDLDDLVAFYKDYQRLMKHWHETSPLPILDVRYEDVVAEQETESRRMFEFLELEWDERCLEFYSSDRVVVTASHEQVKKPIYNISLQRWKNYEKHIEPLIKGLSE